MAYVLAIVGYLGLSLIWRAGGDWAEAEWSYDAWFFSLALASVIVGVVLGRAWAVALAIIPVLVTADEWTTTSCGEDTCFAAAVWIVLLPACTVALGVGILIRRSWPTVWQLVRRLLRRASSTIEERHADQL